MNHYLPKLLLIWLLIGISSAALAQQIATSAQTDDEHSTEISIIEVESGDEVTQEQTEPEKQSYWELEVGGAFMLGRYAMDSFNDSERGYYNIAPWLAGGYYNGNFFIESDPGNGKPLTIGYTSYESDSLQINLVGMPFFFGFEEDSQVRGDLLSGLEAREASFDAGIEVLSGFENGQIGVRLLKDISGTHKGAALDVVYGYPLYFDKTVIWPSVGFSYVTDKANNYYYGIRPDEVRQDRPLYQADGGLVAKFNLYFEHELSESNSIIGFSQVNVLNSAIVDSPIVEHRFSWTIGVGYIWIY